MGWFLIALLSAGALGAADIELLAVARKAQADFARVEAAPEPRLEDTQACVQSEAAWLAVAPLTEAAHAHYQKGYCLLAGATVSRSPAAFQQAAAEFEAAGGPALLTSLARVQANTGDEALLRQAVAQPGCGCEAALKSAREWLGSMDLGRGNLVAAAEDFAAAAASAWQRYVAGRQADDLRRFRDAPADYGAAVDAWDAERRQPAGGIFERLRPRPDIGDALIRLGGAQLLAGDAAAAIVTLDRAVKTDPAAARAYYLRARAHETAGQKDQALADYNLASRAAFASAQDLASGEAHLYRGILLYRRGNFSGAEDEFSSALNFKIAPDMHADAAAWRHLAAVAAGGCQAAREALGRSLGIVSPYFPTDEATRRMNACPTE